MKTNETLQTKGNLYIENTKTLYKEEKKVYQLTLADYKKTFVVKANVEIPYVEPRKISKEESEKIKKATRLLTSTKKRVAFEGGIDSQGVINIDYKTLKEGLHGPTGASVYGDVEVYSFEEHMGDFDIQLKSKDFQESKITFLAYCKATTQETVSKLKKAFNFGRLHIEGELKGSQIRISKVGAANG